MDARERSVWVLAEHTDGGGVHPASYEAAALAARVAEAIGGGVALVVIARPARPVAERLAEKTGLDVIGLDTESAVAGNPEAYRVLLRDLARAHPPRFLFLAHTPLGWDLAPALAVDLGASSLSAVCGLAEGPELTFLRRILNGKLLEEVRPLPDRPAVATVSPGAEAPHVSKRDGPGQVWILARDAPPTRTTVVGYREPPSASVRLREAEVIVAAGRGVGDAEGLECIHALARLFPRSAVGASRPLCDAGLLPLSCQVGMTGQTVAPKVYIACGISGAVQHTLGMKRSGLVIAVNKDPNAPFCREAHYSVVADLHAFLPVWIERIRRFRREPPEE